MKPRTRVSGRIRRRGSVRLMILLKRKGRIHFLIGAYEFQGPFRNSRTDINRDGKVDAQDLCIFLNDWGEVSGP